MGERPEYMPPGIAESIENAGDIVKKYANKAIEYARDNIRKRFEEETDNPENNLEYHRRDHTDAVLRRVDAILNTLKAFCLISANLLLFNISGFLSSFLKKYSSLTAFIFL